MLAREDSPEPSKLAFAQECSLSQHIREGCEQFDPRNHDLVRRVVGQPPMSGVGCQRWNGAHGLSGSDDSNQGPRQ